MSLTQIQRDNQIKPGSAYNWVTNDSTGAMSQTAVSASSAVATDSNGLPVASTTTATELGYVHGVTSAIQTQFSGKLSLTGGTMTGNITLSDQHAIIFNDTEGSPKAVTLEAPTTLTNSYDLYWPLDQGGASTVLTNDGSGNLSWASSLTTSLTESYIFMGDNTNNASAVLVGGDATLVWASAGVSTLTLATVNSDTGSFGSSTSIPTFTVNAKGLITAASGNAVVAPAGTLTGTTLASNVVTSSLTSLGIQSQALDMGTHAIIDMANPSNPQDAATKYYVDNLVQGLNWKETAITATTADLGSVTYNNGTAGVGATLTNAGTQAALVLDGVTVAVNDRVLVKNQATDLQNGIYVVTNTGSVSTNWVLTRSTDANTPSSLQWATLEIGPDATTQGGYIYRESADITTIGTDSVTFTLVSQGINWVFGAGLKTTGNTVSITTDTSLTTQTNTNPTLAVNVDPAGAVVTGGSGIYVNVDGTTIDISSNAIEVKAGGITDTQVSASAGIAVSKLSHGTNAQIIISNGSTNSWNTVSGDATISNSGVVSISGGLTAHFVTREVPTGSINGSNVTFTLANTPTTGTECVYLNGLLQNAGGNDYSITTNTITFIVAPETGSVILVNYQK